MCAHLANCAPYTIYQVIVDVVTLFKMWDKIRQVYPPKNFLSPISLKVREIIDLVNLF